MMDKNELLFKLRSEIGLSIGQDFSILDQDYGTIVFLHGKTLKGGFNNQEPRITYNDIYFDPINNVKLMRTLFQYYVNKIRELENRYFSVFYPVFGDNGLGSMVIKNETEVYKSRYYHNEALRYIDLIFKISGNDYDLSNFDQVR